MSTHPQDNPTTAAAAAQDGEGGGGLEEKHLSVAGGNRASDRDGIQTGTAPIIAST